MTLRACAPLVAGWPSGGRSFPAARWVALWPHGCAPGRGGGGWVQPGCTASASSLRASGAAAALQPPAEFALDRTSQGLGRACSGSYRGPPPWRKDVPGGSALPPLAVPGPGTPTSGQAGSSCGGQGSGCSSGKATLAVCWWKLRQCFYFLYIVTMFYFFNSIKRLSALLLP